MIKGIGSRGIDTLLALHGGLHHSVMGLESIDVVLVIGKDLLLDALAEAVLSHELDDLGGVFLLGVDPTDHLVDILRGTAGMKLVGLDHGLADRGRGLLDLLDDGRIVKDSAGDLENFSNIQLVILAKRSEQSMTTINICIFYAHIEISTLYIIHLAMSATKAEDKVEGRLLLDVVVRESAAVLELLAGEDETLLIGGDALLVLDLGLDVVNGVRGLDIEGDGLARESLDENLHGSNVVGFGELK